MQDELSNIDSMVDVSPLELAEIPLDVTHRAARTASEAAPDADAMLISGSNFPSIELIEALETDLGIPVTTSNQAALSEALRIADVAHELEEWGSLLGIDFGDIEG